MTANTILFFSLVLLPGLGLIIAALLIIFARREQELDFSADAQSRSRSLVLILLCNSSVLYGLVEMLLLKNSGLDLSLLEGVAPILIACAVLGFVSALAKGIACASGVRQGALTDQSAFSQTIVKAALAEVPGIAGLLLFVLNFLN